MLIIAEEYANNTCENVCTIIAKSQTLIHVCPIFTPSLIGSIVTTEKKIAFRKTQLVSSLKKT